KVLVVGGGPGGSIAATFLTQGGADVTLLEREHFPRYHIGESVAPSCRAIIEFAGAGEKVDARGYPVKRGVLLRWGAESDWAVNWQQMFGEDIRSWQVDRDDFDEVLLRHAASQGATVIEGATVRRINFAGERAVSAEWTHDGTAHTSEFDHVVDASGRAGVLAAKQFRSRRPHEVFRNVAIWGYYPGGELLPGTPPGGIDVISSPDGWYWVIPLRGGQFSVGYVTHQNNFLLLRQEHRDLRDLFLSLVESSETVREQVAGHELIGDVRVEQDFSYSADSFCGPGYYLAGDAACF